MLVETPVRKNLLRGQAAFLPAHEGGVHVQNNAVQITGREAVRIAQAKSFAAELAAKPLVSRVAAQWERLGQENAPISC